MILWDDLPGETMWTLQAGNGRPYGPIRYTRSQVIDEVTGWYDGGKFANKTREQKWRMLRANGVRVVRVKIVPENIS